MFGLILKMINFQSLFVYISINLLYMYCSSKLVSLIGKLSE